LSDMTERAHSLQESIEKLKMKLTTTQNGEASAQNRVAELEQALAAKTNSLTLITKECDTLRNLLGEAESTGRMLKAKCESLESDKQKLNASLIVGAEKEALMAARGRETTEQLQEMLKSAAKAQDEMRRQQSSTEASASDYAHKCDVLAASLRDSQAHCRDLEKQIESSLSKVAHGHEAVRRLQDELVTKSVEVSTEQFQSRDLRSQIDSLVEDHKRQNEVLFFMECSFVREILTFVFLQAANRTLNKVCLFEKLNCERIMLLFLAKFAIIMTLIDQANRRFRIERDRRSRLRRSLALRSCLCQDAGTPEYLFQVTDDIEISGSPIHFLCHRLCCGEKLTAASTKTDNLLHLVNRESSERIRFQCHCVLRSVVL